MEKEVRSLDISPMAANDRMISGYALKFNTVSNLIRSKDQSFFEIIMPGAITEQFIYNQDVKCFFNHCEDSGILARSNKGKGSLSLTVDSTGVFYSFKAKNSPLDEQVYQSIKAGDITGSSFAFTVAEGGDKWERSGNQLIRRIYKIGGFWDVSPVVNPAYNSSSVSARNIQQVTNTEDLRAYHQNLQNIIDEAKNTGLKQYYADMKKQYRL